MNVKQIEWIGEAGWNADIGNVKRGMRLLVPPKIADDLVKQGEAKIIKSKSDKGGK